jgi:hypothetical protein
VGKEKTMPWSTTIPQYHLSTGLEPSPEQKEMKTNHGPNSHSREYPVSLPNQIINQKEINRDMNEKRRRRSKRDMTVGGEEKGDARHMAEKFQLGNK